MAMLLLDVKHAAGIQYNCVKSLHTFSCESTSPLFLHAEKRTVKIEEPEWFAIIINNVTTLNATGKA